jgi:hypothetical protein
MFAPPNAVRLCVSIDEIQPVIWRRLVVPAHWNLEQLHLTIQAAFNWWNCHLHEFHIGGLRFGDVAVLEDAAFADDPRVFEEGEVRLRDFSRAGTTFAYNYDFGDDWRHRVELEEWLSLDVSPRKATCAGGARAHPPEDVGGVPGYEHFLEVIGDPEDPEHADIKRWCGGHFDPEWFDLDTVNNDVGNALKPNVRRRLHQPKPKRS